MRENKTHFINIFNSSKLQSFISKRPYSLSEVIQDTSLNNSPLIQMNQTHSNHSEEITTKQSKMIEDTDAIYTTQENILLTVKTADCLPILIFHPKPLIAVIHAGRKGTDQHITTSVR